MEAIRIAESFVQFVHAELCIPVIRRFSSQLLDESTNYIKFPENPSSMTCHEQLDKSLRDNVVLVGNTDIFGYCLSHRF